jgi:uncharacterized protein (DUF2236 family)
VGPLSGEEADRYVAEMVRQAVLVGLQTGDIPATEAANHAFIESCTPDLLVTRSALEAVDTVLHPPLSAWRRPFWWVAGQAAISLMPDDALALLGMRRNRRAEAAVRPLVQQGAAFGRRRMRPPPVLVQARRRTEAAGLRF